MNHHILTSCVLMLLCTSEAKAQFRVFVGDRPSENGELSSSQPNHQAAPKQDLIKQEPQLDTYDPATDLPAVKKQLRPGERLLGNVIERQLAIEWDSWHSKFARAVKSHMFSNAFEAINVRPGAITWYHCEVTPDKHLKNIRISKSSGDFWFDSAVINAINKIDGMDLLAYPSGSSRTLISTDIGIQFGGGRIGGTGDVLFNDVEFRQLAPGEQPEVAKDTTAAEVTAPSKKHKHRTQID